MVEQLSVISSRGVESINDAFKEVAAKSFKESSPVRSSMVIIENASLERLKAQNEAISFTETETPLETEEGDSSEENEGLSEEEKQQIKNETGWSDEIIDAIGSMEEYRIYRDAGLQEVEINGRKCLVRSDIDWDQKDSMGRTNKERAEAGLSPINKEGDTIELHHIGQKSDGPLAELTPDEHRGKENYSVLHDTQKESEIDRVAFNGERSNHWKERAGEGVQNA
ncbi:MAG: HNH/ENDO VII family nuclease [Pseudomonadales bacterium]|nr:HNH/ENDO VII family nuclease [Pseudomonadales bacterium]